MRLVAFLFAAFTLVAAQDIVVNPNGYHYSSEAITELMLRIMSTKAMNNLSSDATNATVCWKDSYGRGVGRPVSTCSGDNPDKSGLLCYPYCKDNYHGVGPVCWEACESGYTDEGALCGRSGKIISADNSDCPWYDKCGLTLKKGCSKCPDGYHNDGCTCRIDPHVYAKKSYGRGAGVPLGCSPQEYDAGLCYDYCTDRNKAQYYGVGPVCWEKCPAHAPADNGAICCTSAADCNEKVVELSQAVLSAIAAALAAGEDPKQIIAAVKQAIEAILGFVLPLCYDFA